MYVEPVVVDTSSLNMSEPAEVPSVQVVPPVALPDLTFNTASDPSFVTVCVSLLPAVVVAVLSATEPNAIEPSATETARLFAVIVAETVAVLAAPAICHTKRLTRTANPITPKEARTSGIPMSYYYLPYIFIEGVV